MSCNCVKYISDHVLLTGAASCVPLRQVLILLVYPSVLIMDHSRLESAQWIHYTKKIMHIFMDLASHLVMIMRVSY